ncbi:MAG: hypothetical protein QOD26_3208 [Betaproteobacteria bacterium]|jgi:hypothetical protein|nr:hypothetical protein [Betaproteobacteria bacterium]
MEFTLSVPEKEHLRLIADALERKASLETDEQLLGALIRKCMVRTNGKSLKLTDLGRRQLKD